MKNREPFDLRWLLVPWNAALTIFSATGFYYTWPVLMENLFSKPLTSVLCDPACYSNHVARWVFFFNVSKFFVRISPILSFMLYTAANPFDFQEFGDTLFIVLRKKPLIFLHYYHHVMTCLYCWYANQVSCSTNCTGWPFATMNLFVHTLMYFHYALAGMGIHANWSVLLTSLQLLQMVVGIGIVSYSALYCPNAQDFTFGTYFALIMYFSYAVLFANFFIQRYCGPKRTSRKSKTE